jgi:hypothetical protein
MPARGPTDTSASFERAFASATSGNDFPLGPMVIVAQGRHCVHGLVQCAPRKGLCTKSSFADAGESVQDARSHQSAKCWRPSVQRTHLDRLRPSSKAMRGEARRHCERFHAWPLTSAPSAERACKLPRLMSAFVKVFGCRPMTVDAPHTEGRRTKTSRGGNRDGSGVVAAGAMGN